jgi:hypothetical protein
MRLRLRQPTSFASKPPSPAHLPPQTCVSSTRTPHYLHLFLITVIYLTYLSLFVSLTLLTPPSLSTSLTSRGTGTPTAGLGLGRRTGRRLSSNAPPRKLFTTPHPSLPKHACSRSGTKTMRHVSRIHPTSHSPNHHTPITSTLSSKG